MMAIQNSQAPRGQNENPGAGKQYADERDRQVASFFLKSEGDYGHDVRRREYADEHYDRGNERQDAEDGIRHARGLFFVILGQQFGIDGNERSGKRALAEDVLKKVGNAKGGAESIAFRGAAEVVGEDALPHQADDAADENSGADKECRAARAGRRWFRGDGWFNSRGGAYLFDSFAGDRPGRFVSGDFAVSCQRAYSFILLRRVL